MGIKMNFATAAFSIAVACVLSLGEASASEPLRDYLHMEKGCYPVGYDEASEKISTVCRGQKNWRAEGVVYFSKLRTNSAYPGEGMWVNLQDDIDSGAGIGPFFKYYLRELDRMGIPHL